MDWDTFTTTAPTVVLRRTRERGHTGWRCQIIEAAIPILPRHVGRFALGGDPEAKRRVRDDIIADPEFRAGFSSIWMFIFAALLKAVIAALIDYYVLPHAGPDTKPRSL